MAAHPFSFVLISRLPSILLPPVGIIDASQRAAGRNATTFPGDSLPFCAAETSDLVHRFGSPGDLEAAFGELRAAEGTTGPGR